MARRSKRKTAMKYFVVYSLLVIILAIMAVPANAIKSDDLKTVNVANIQPVSDFSITQSEKVDLLFSLANTQYSDINTMTGKINNLVVTPLRANNIDINFTIENTGINNSKIAHRIYYYGTGSYPWYDRIPQYYDTDTRSAVSTGLNISGQWTGTGNLPTAFDWISNNGDFLKVGSVQQSGYTQYQVAYYRNTASNSYGGSYSYADGNASTYSPDNANDSNMYTTANFTSTQVQTNISTGVQTTLPSTDKHAYQTSGQMQLGNKVISNDYYSTPSNLISTCPTQNYNAAYCSSLGIYGYPVSSASDHEFYYTNTNDNSNTWLYDLNTGANVFVRSYDYYKPSTIATNGNFYYVYEDGGGNTYIQEFNHSTHATQTIKYFPKSGNITTMASFAGANANTLLYWTAQYDTVQKTFVTSNSAGRIYSYITARNLYTGAEWQTTFRDSNGPNTNGYSAPNMYLENGGCLTFGFCMIGTHPGSIYSGKNIYEVIGAHSYRSDAFKYYVSVCDTNYPELSDVAVLPSDVAALANNSMGFYGLGNGNNAGQFQALVQNTGGNGAYFDNSNIDAALTNLANDIIGKYNTTRKTVTNKLMLPYNRTLGTFMPSGTMTYPTYYSDYESDAYYDSRWIFNHDPHYENSMGMFPQSGQFMPSPISQFTQVGIYDILRQVRDNPKNVASFDPYRMWSNNSKSKYIVYVHRQPVAAFAASATWNGSSYNVNINENSYDSDFFSTLNHGITQKVWKYKDVNSTAWNNGLPSTMSSGQNWAISLQVQDTDGAWSDPYIQVVSTTGSNLPPVALFDVNPGEVSLGQGYTITDRSMDPNGDALTAYEWSVYRYGQLIWQAGYAPDANTLRNAGNARGWGAEGNYSISLRVKDASLWSQPYAVGVNVFNHAPVPNFTTVATAYRDTGISVTNQTTEPDGDGVSYSWNLYKDNVANFTQSTAVNPSFAITNYGYGKNAVGTWYLTLTATDSYGMSASIKKPIEITNHAPTAGISGPNASQIKQSATYTSTGTDADPEDVASLQYFWKLTSPGGVVSNATGKTYSVTFNEGGNYRLDHWTVDQLGDSSNVASQTIAVDGNLHPIAGFTLSKTNTYRGDPIDITSTAKDPDGYIDGYQYFITPPGGSEFLYSTDKRIKNFTLSAGSVGTYTIRQVVTDDMGATDQISHNFTIYNRTPSVVVTTPSGPDISHPSGQRPPFNIQWTYSDPDGDPQSKNVVKVYQASDNALIFNTNIVSSSTNSQNFNMALPAGVKYYATVEVFDGYTWSGPSAPKYFITNQPPVVAFTWNPNPAWEGDNIQLVNQSTDPDGDAMTYSWSVTPSAGGSTTTSTLTQPTIPTAQPTGYNVTLTACDMWNDCNSISKTIPVTAITISGYVNHTALWDAHRIEYNQSKTGTDSSPRTYDMFFPGEKFVLHADTTGPITGTDVSILGTLFSTSLSGGPAAWNGELWDASMERWDNQTIYFRFTETTRTGYTKSVDVPITIDDDPYWRQQRTR